MLVLSEHGCREKAGNTPDSVNKGPECPGTSAPNRKRGSAIGDDGGIVGMSEWATNLVRRNDVDNEEYQRVIDDALRLKEWVAKMSPEERRNTGYAILFLVFSSLIIAGIVLGIMWIQ